MDAPIYLEYLRNRIKSAGGSITYGVELTRLEDVQEDFRVVLNCTGYGARVLVSDADIEAHRGQIAIVEPLDATGLSFAFVSEDSPLTYVIPRSQDCVFGGWNEISESEIVDHAITTGIVAECSRVLRPLLTASPVLKDERVGLRPFRSSGVRIATELLLDGRRVIHNYGHGGAGFSLSWGCAHKSAELVERYTP
jgi:D-amino-acid oxidase